MPEGPEQVETWLTDRRNVTREELGILVKLARDNGGELVNLTAFGGGGRDPDDWCGTMWFKKPRPKVGGLVEILLERGWTVEIFPYGIINPDALQVVVRNQAGRPRGL
jgi:hypothetical protein